MIFSAPDDHTEWNKKLRLRIYRACVAADEKLFDLTQRVPRVGNWIYDHAPEVTEGRLPWLICTLLRAHEPMEDNCGKPEHDYCLYCRLSRPYSVGDVKQRYFRLFERKYGTQYDDDPDPWGGMRTLLMGLTIHYSVLLFNLHVLTA